MTNQIYSLTDARSKTKFNVTLVAIAARTPLLCARLDAAWRFLALGGSAVLALALAGCAPSHNWREVRHEGAPGVALFPCKPDRAVRDVAMLGPEGPTAPLHMLSCDVQGRTYAWAAWPLKGMDKGHAVMQAWQQASWASLMQRQGPNQEPPAGWVARPVTQAGAVVAVRWQGPAVNHTGQAIEAQWLMLYTPEWAMQMAVYGPAATPAVLEPFWTELKLPQAGVAQPVVAQ